MSPSPTPAPRRDVYTVSRLNREARLLLEQGLPGVWIEGELSNFARPSSGHWYFTLKDETAQVRCAMFRNANLRVRVQPRDGMQVVVRARVSLYEARGEYQLIAEHLEEAGEGALRRRFDELKARLQAEGLFEAALKRPLPALPRRIGVVTSPTGAAIRDIVHVLGRRFPAVPVIVYPVPVQGAGAGREIAAALALAGERRDADVLILARGGGSLEDLWAFNEEVVARAIRACPIPVVSGVGHEVDFTIADFAADVRAPTPSGAAELVVPDRAEWLRALGAARERLARAFGRVGALARERLQWLVRRLELAHPRTRLAARAQRLDELEQRLGRAVRRELAAARSRLGAAARTLNAVSPLATLERGYSIVTTRDGAVVRAARDVEVGADVEVRTAAGGFGARVTRR
ncbi:MAG: exodeoxyribonuclease VII large subunit [Proteobacteria bacterium]|nr:exodeoxyribonuclease VII large subunit [Pseudomonadota bacterium]